MEKSIKKIQIAAYILSAIAAVLCIVGLFASSQTAWKVNSVIFGSESFDSNMRFIENALGKSIRDYFNKDFYKDHLKTYQKRPIYRMYSSPDGNFKALVYLHRCDKHTPDVVLKYMREFRSKIQSQLEIAKREHSADEIKYSRIDKDLDNYDKILYSLALKQIELDLDDGVKVNYAKIGSALYPVDGLNVEKK